MTFAFFSICQHFFLWDLNIAQGDVLILSEPYAPDREPLCLEYGSRTAVFLLQSEAVKVCLLPLFIAPRFLV
jgi:hypothetical protein